MHLNLHYAWCQLRILIVLRNESTTGLSPINGETPPLPTAWSGWHSLRDVNRAQAQQNF